MDEATPETTAREVGSRRRSHKAPPTDPSTTQHGAPQPMRAAILPSTVTSDETDVSHVLRMLRRRKAVVLGTTTFMVVLAVLVTLLRSAQYEATAEVLLRRPIAVTGGVADATDPERAIQDEIRFIESDVTPAARHKAPRAGGEHQGLSRCRRRPPVVHRQRWRRRRGGLAANAYAQAYLELRADELDSRCRRSSPADRGHRSTPRRAPDPRRRRSVAAGRSGGRCGAFAAGRPARRGAEHVARCGGPAGGRR